MSTTYGPYSVCQRAGDLLFTAGQLGAIKGKAPEGVREQARQALLNLEHVLGEEDYSLSDVVKVNIYLTNIQDFATMNEVYREVFAAAGSQPARTTVGVTGLPNVADKPLLIEIEATAYKSGKANG